MGSFKQHMTCSTITGVVVGGAAYHWGLSMPTCLLGGGLCSMAGMLPDIDSDTSRSFQECIYLAAGLAAVLWVHRLLQFGLTQDLIILNGAGMFLFVRFVVGEFIKKLTVHRGMFHSIPAAILTGEILFFLSAGTKEERVFKAFAITAGYLSHLILDEYYSIDSTGKTLRLKKSFGTALKFMDTKRMQNTIFVYAVIFFIGFTAVHKPELVEQFEVASDESAEAVKEDAKPGSKIVDFLRNLESEAASAMGERKVAIQREVAEYLVQREQAPETPAIQQPETQTARPSSRRRRYAEHRMFAQSRNVEPAMVQVSNPSNLTPLSGTALTPLSGTAQNTSATVTNPPPYQMTTLRGVESAPGIPSESTVVTSQHIPQQTPVYSPPQFTSQTPMVAPSQPMPSIQSQAPEVQSHSSPLGIIGNGFSPGDRSFSLPKREPTPVFMPSK